MTKNGKNHENQGQEYQDLIKEWEVKIIVHAWKDKHFRERFVANPKKALEEINCPSSVYKHLNIKVIEPKESEWLFVLPKSPTDAHTLSEAELSTMVQGGIGNNWTQPFAMTAGVARCM